MADTPARIAEPTTLYFGVSNRVNFNAVLIPYLASIVVNLPPVVTLVTPPAGAIGENDSITVLATDTDLARSTVWVEYNQGSWEVAYARATFSPVFVGSTLNTVTNAVTGITTATFVLTRTGGWPYSGFTVQVEAIDADGQVG